ncbi:MAG: glutamine--fructose-6-phosphate transaminase (isomerizing) [Verrucomicrobiales bacterium]|jgi:glucosamine--fructose-6-phosphate aminotransferase (isomerizing)|nr:glutamine--fructose-6-phosphate transaminase (isomerizing) [Verrucomicrobiales bacterium]
MCGIIAYVGDRDVQPVLLDGLSRLEYRGYDSAGIAVHSGNGIRIQKRAGRIAELAKAVVKSPLHSTSGISHTRWATHGEPTDTNAHPHLDQSGRIALVHNGVVENYQTIKQALTEKGHVFHSATDTEVLAHLVGEHYDKLSSLQGANRLVAAIKAALSEIDGTYGIAVIHQDLPNLVVGARRGSPLVLGIGEKEQFLSSDAAALSPYTQKVIYLKDFDIVTLQPGKFDIQTIGEREVSYEIKELDFKPEAAEKGKFAHYMLKEIFEQPTAIKNAMRGRLDKETGTAHLGGLNLTNEQLRDIRRIIVLGCGTALYSGMVGEQMIETTAHLPVETDFSSEFRYRNTPLENDTLFFVVSQSGETADTLGALREAQRKGHRVLGICNNVGSTIARESDGGVYMHAGPEIGVAATKSFVSQTTIFALLSLKLGRMRYLSAANGHEIIHALEQLPAQVEAILAQSDYIKKIAEKYAASQSMLFFGRQGNYPIALEGALKMKEITYIHAEGYPSSELKHGVIALIDKKTPSVVIAPHDSLYDKNMNSIQEIKARCGPVICLTTNGNKEIDSNADDVIKIPQTLELLQPILNVVPLQLLAYHTAVALGRDIDKPRNLAKSVTVE